MPVALATAPIGMRAVFVLPALVENLRVVIGFVLSTRSQLTVEFILWNYISTNYKQKQ